jgi:prepilin-type N-terminal cleavage/methylation domain-containing protein
MVRHAAGGTTDGSVGFTLTELMFVVLIIGILVAVVLPVLAQAAGHAEKRTCYASQRTIEGAVMVWQAQESGNISALAGVVNGSHALVTGGYLKRPPACPSAPHPADPNNPSSAEGAYTLNATAAVLPCTFGSLGAHGSYRGP